MKEALQHDEISEVPSCCLLVSHKQTNGSLLQQFPAEQSELDNWEMGDGQVVMAEFDPEECLLAADDMPKSRRSGPAPEHATTASRHPS